jgi:hypothetical protein
VGHRSGKLRTVSLPAGFNLGVLGQDLIPASKALHGFTLGIKA